MSIPGAANPLLLASAASTQYTVSRSLRFNSSDSGYCGRTFTSAGNRQSWTWSGWVKRSNPDTGARQVLFSAYGASNDTGYFEFGFDNSANLGKFYWSQWTVDAQSAAVFRDFSAWYHIVVNYNGSNIVVYVNGISVLTSAKTGDLAINGAFEHNIGRQPNSGRYFDGYLADIHFIDGQALTPSSFTETSATTGQLIPKAYTGTYGTNGFKLTFSDNSNTTATTLGKDSSPNGNNWTPTNFSVTAGAGNDSLVDTPSSAGTDSGLGGQVTGNYATLNNLLNTSGSYANGNLERTSSDNTGAIGTICPSSGNWYAEFTWTTIGSAAAGVVVTNLLTSSGTNGLTQSWQLGYQSQGKLENAGSQSNVASFVAGDVIAVSFNCSTGAATFYKNGVSVGTVTNSAFANIPVGIGAAHGGVAGTNTVIANFGQRPFAYTAPSGFKALCDTNLPTPVVAKPETVFQVIRYTGNGSSQTIPNVNTVPTTLGFSPDLVWIKSRSTGTLWHEVFDAIRGANNRLFTNATNAETTNNTLSSFNSNGFTLSITDSNGYGVNLNNDSYVAWAWDAGTTTTTNTQGSITSSVRANASAGFSIVTWTGNGTQGASVGHGLGVKPSLLIFKNRSVVDNWAVLSDVLLGTGYYVYLNKTDAKAYNANNLAPSSTVINLAQYTDQNGNGNSMVCYAWAPVAGYSSMGSYVGNGSSDGPFVYTGHRSRWILLKRTDAVTDWWIYDTARDTYNVMGTILYPNLSDAEFADTTVFGRDLLSNGFKVRTSNAFVNGNGATYIYASFAEFPFQYARAR